MSDAFGSELPDSVRLILAIQTANDDRNHTALANALEETCTLICVAGESFVRSIDASDYVHTLVGLLTHKNTQVSLLSMRGLALMADTVPKACNAMITQDAIGVMLGFAKRKPFLASNSPFAEELLKCLEILSLEAHAPMLGHNAITLLVGLTSALKDRLRFSALCCVVNLVSACRPQDMNLVEVSVPHLNGLLTEQITGTSLTLTDGKRFKDADLTHKVCVCFAHILDRVTVKNSYLERFLNGEGRSLVPNMVSVLQYADQSSQPLLLRRSAIGVLTTMFASSPTIALNEFVHHHALQSVFSVTLDLVTSVEDKLNFESVGKVPEGGGGGGAAANNFGGLLSNDASAKVQVENLPLLSQEQNCVLLLEFLLFIMPRALGTWDEYNITLPHHGWQWEDDFHNHNEYDEDLARKLEEEYQRQQSGRRFKPFEIFQGTRAVSVDFEHLKFLTSQGAHSRPFFRSPILSYFFHRRALVLQDRCRCFGGGVEEPAPVAPKSAENSSSNNEEGDGEAKEQKSSSPGCFSKFMACMSCASDDSPPSDVKHGEEICNTRDVREEKLLSDASRSTFIQPETMRLLLSTLVPSLLSLVNSVVNTVVVRHVSILLLRCLSLTKDFLARFPDIAPKALEVLVLEAPQLAQSLDMMLGAVSVEAGIRMSVPTMVQMRVPRTASRQNRVLGGRGAALEDLNEILRSSPTLSAALSTQGETLSCCLSSCCLLVELLGDNGLKLLWRQGLRSKLKLIENSLQKAYDNFSEDDRNPRLHTNPNATAAIAAAAAVVNSTSASSAPVAGGGGGPAPAVAQPTSSHSDRSASSAQAVHAPPPCQLHTSKVHWIKEALGLQQPLLKQMTALTMLRHSNSDLSSLQHMSSSAGPSATSVTSMSGVLARAHLNGGAESPLSQFDSPTTSAPAGPMPGRAELLGEQQHGGEAISCWELMEEVNSALSNEDVSLETFFDSDPHRSLARLASLLQQESREYSNHTAGGANREGLNSQRGDSSVSSLPATAGGESDPGQDANWIPHSNAVTAHNLAHNLARRVGRFVDLAGTHTHDTQQQQFHTPNQRGMMNGRTRMQTLATPFSLQMMEDRLIRPFSLRVTQYDPTTTELPPPAATSAGTSDTGRPGSSSRPMSVQGKRSRQTILVDGKVLQTVALKSDYDESILCLPFASIAALQRDILARTTRLIADPEVAGLSGTRTSSNGDNPSRPDTGNSGSQSLGHFSRSSERYSQFNDEPIVPKKPVHVLLFVGGMPLRNPSMTLLDALCQYGASAFALRRLVESPPSLHRQTISKALSIWLSQHPIQFALVTEAPPPELRYSSLGCSCELSRSHYCTPMHHYTKARVKYQDHALTHCLEILHILMPALRRPGQVVPGSLRKMYSSVIHDMHSQSATFLVPCLAPLCHTVLQTDRLEATLATYALWNYPQVFPLSLRFAIFTLTTSTGNHLAAKALASTVLLQRRPIVGAEWSTATQHMNQQLMHFPHSPFFMASTSTIPKKLKLNINREKILTEAFEIFDIHAACPVPFDVEFKGEPGSGLGPTLEFFSLAAESLTKTEGLWVQGRADDLLVPAYPLVVDGAGELLELLGSIIGRCLKEKRQVGLRLHPLFWAAILGTADSQATKAPGTGSSSDAPSTAGSTPVPGTTSILTLSTMSDPPTPSAKMMNRRTQATSVSQAQITERQLVDPAIEASLNSILRMSPADVVAAQLTWTVPGTEVSLLPEGETIVVTPETTEEYVTAVRAHYATHRLSMPVDAISRGIQKVFSPCHLRLFTGEELTFLLCGPRGKIWNSPQALANDIVCDHGYTANSMPVRLLIEVVEKWPEELQRKFLLFISGSQCLPIGGLKPKITIVRKDPEEAKTVVPSPEKTAETAPVAGGGAFRSPVANPLLSPITPERQTTTSSLGGFTPGVNNQVDMTLPTCNTCFHYVKLPEYTDPEVLEHRLLYAMTEGADSFGLS